MREKYLLKLNMCLQNFSSRVKFQTANNDSFLWGEIFEELICFSRIVADDPSKLDEEDLREYLSLFEFASFIHDPKNPMDERKRHKELLRTLLDSIKPRYAYLMGLNEEELIVKMNREYTKLTGTKLGTEISSENKVTNRPLRLKQQTEMPVQEDILDEQLLSILESKRSNDERVVKEHIAFVLMTGYENIVEFERKYKKYSDFRSNIKDISKTLNPQIRYKKIQAMKEHLTKLKRYYNTIIQVYNELYNTLKSNKVLSLTELEDLQTLVYKFTHITESLKNSLGNTTVTILEKRRIDIQKRINEYNEYIELMKQKSNIQPRRFS